MAGYTGRRFQIVKSAHKTCDPTGSSQPHSMSQLRRMPDAVHLATRCDGADHDGCEARCLLFWKKAWLRPVEESGSSETSPASMEGIDLNRLRAATRRTTKSSEFRYRCQLTEIVPATTPLPIVELRQYFEDVSSGNVSFVDLVREFARAYVKAIVRRALALAWRGGSRHSARVPAAAAKLDLQVGERVQVRPAKDILATLNAEWKNRGLAFEREMLRHCGHTYRVLARVTRIIDEKSGRMIMLANECIALEGVTCHGRDKCRRLFCPREPYFYWREAWLRRTDEQRSGAMT
jgi:hypothetical protein